MLILSKNSARCKNCDDVIVSKHRHDFVWCKCRALAVDGGLDYAKRVGRLNGFEDLNEYTEDGREPVGREYLDDR